LEWQNLQFHIHALLATIVRTSVGTTVAPFIFGWLFAQGVVKTGVTIPRLVVKLTVENASQGNPDVVRHLLGLPITAAAEPQQDPLKKTVDGKLVFSNLDLLDKVGVCSWLTFSPPADLIRPYCIASCIEPVCMHMPLSFWSQLGGYSFNQALSRVGRSAASIHATLH
jgi:hypothetical protein